MKHNTKFDIDESLWFIYKDKLVNKTVNGIRYVKFISPINFEIKESERYYFDGIEDSIETESLFRTKEELISTL